MSARAAIYLDSNAGAPLRPQVLEALLPFLQDPSRIVPNPSSVHSHGRRGRRALTDAREQVACSLGSETNPLSVTFTSSGTEANQLAIRSELEPRLKSGGSPHWILTAVEHDSVLRCVRWLESNGGSVSFLPVASSGEILWEELPGLLQPETALVSAIWVNNETGVISKAPESVRSVLLNRGIPLHGDAAQAWGKLELSAAKSGYDHIALSGHKIGALGGIGALWSLDASGVESTLFGLQEFERRGGTENLLGAISLGAAAGCLKPSEWTRDVAISRDRLQRRVVDRVPGSRIHGGHAAHRVANTLNLGFDGLEKPGLVPALDLEGYSVSSGSACSSGVEKASHVLLAMGMKVGSAKSAIRISLSEPLSESEEARFVDALSKCVERLRSR